MPLTQPVVQRGAHHQKQGTWEVRRSEGADEPLQRRVAGPGAAQEVVQAAGQGAQVAPGARVAQRAQQAAHQAIALCRDDLLHRVTVDLRVAGFCLADCGSHNSGVPADSCVLVRSPIKLG